MPDTDIASVFCLMTEKFKAATFVAHYSYCELAAVSFC